MPSPPEKKVRLSLACDECRRRKVKCDTDYPTCRNCRQRKDTCITTDPKHPEIPVERKWIDIPPKSALVSRKISTGSDKSSPTPPKTTPVGDIDRNLAPPFDAGSTLQGSTRVPLHSTSVKPTRDTGLPAASPYDGAAASIASEASTRSAVYQTHNMHFNIERDKIKMMGGSSSQCLSSSLDIYHRSTDKITANFRHGMSHAEEMALPVTAPLCHFPDASRRNSYVSAFFTRIHALFPLFQVDETKHQIEQWAVTVQQPIQSDQVPTLVSAYLVMSIGADEIAGQPTDVGTKYLDVAASLLSHVILSPYLSSVQALVLFTLAYRGRNKDGVGWQMLGMAIRIAHTLGLHRHSVVRPSDQHGVQVKYEQMFHARIWGIICCLEKIMQLEAGRPSAIEKVDCDQMMGPIQKAPGHDFLQWSVGLAQYQGLIINHIYSAYPTDRSARQILQDTAHLDRGLLAWTSQIPSDFRPGSDLFCAPEEYHTAAFISIQYHQTMIALHRAALIAPSKTFEAEVLKHCPDEPSQYRLIGGETICVNSARAIAKITSELVVRKITSRLLNGGPPLLACIVLAIYLIKNADSPLRSSDLELLKTCAEQTTVMFQKTQMDERFCQGINRIYTAIRDQKFRHSRSKPASHSPPSRDNIEQPQAEHTFTRPAPVRSQSTMDANQINRAATLQRHNSIHAVPVTSGTDWFTSPTPANNDMTHPIDWSNMPGGLQTPTNDDCNLDAFGLGVDDPIPFDGLSVQELWSWMLNIDSGDGMLSWDPYIVSSSGT